MKRAIWFLVGFTVAIWAGIIYRNANKVSPRQTVTTMCHMKRPDCTAPREAQCMCVVGAPGDCFWMCLPNQAERTRFEEKYGL